MIVAVAAPVTMFVAPGPIDEVQAKRLQSVLHLREADGGVDLRLLVARLVVAEVGHLLQRLADARHVAVAEDAEAAGEERLSRAVALDVLVLQERDERLRHRRANARAAYSPAPRAHG